MLRFLIRSVLCAMWLVATASSATAVSWSFEGDKLGALPDGWEETRTGEGPGSVWQVVADASAAGSRALAQMSSAGPHRLFNLCVAKDTAYRNPDLTVSVKAVSGVVDQGGGVVWRYVDANNYYIARWNPLETNFRVYKVVSGQRTELQSANVEEAAGEWHVLHVVQSGNRIRGYLNGKLLLDVTDDTFQDAGCIGLWTKADAVTFFDGLRVVEQQ